VADAALPSSPLDHGPHPKPAEARRRDRPAGRRSAPVLQDSVHDARLSDHNLGMARVFVTRALPGDALDRLRGAHDVTVWDGAMPPDPAVLREAVADADGLLCLLTDRVDGALLDAAPRLRAIANYAVGTDNIDLTLTRARGIDVGVTPDVLTEATADLAFALLLAAARRLPEAAADARDGAWRTWEPSGWLGADVFGAALGIVGFGRIGRAVALRAEGFRMSVRSTADTDLDELLAGSDFISLHCPLTPRTRHLIDAAALARMRPTAILVNTARGGVVDQAALIAALQDGEIAGAAIDVTDPEPPPPGDPIYTAPNLLVVPHIGSATRTARARMTELAVENLLAGLDGRPMPHPAG
jgi:glyoxylate reductase